jgi:hypothetical protein
MAETLEEVRERLQRQYLGKARIHGLGISRKHQTIRVYANRGGAEQTKIFEELRAAAKPFSVVVIYEDQAVAS